MALAVSTSLSPHCPRGEQGPVQTPQGPRARQLWEGSRPWSLGCYKRPQGPSPQQEEQPLSREGTVSLTFTCLLRMHTPVRQGRLAQVTGPASVPPRTLALGLVPGWLRSTTGNPRVTQHGSWVHVILTMTSSSGSWCNIHRVLGADAVPSATLSAQGSTDTVVPAVTTACLPLSLPPLRSPACVGG